MGQICCIIGACGPGEILVPDRERTLVIAADGGLRYLEEQAITPDLVVGDFDSLGRVPEGGNILRHPVEKDDTDTMLAVKLGLAQGCDTFLLYGCTGGRPDHTYANYQTLGYLYVEQLSQGKPVADENTVVMVPGPYEYSDPVPGEGLTVEEKQAILDAQWAEKLENTRKLIDESIDYDDEDPVCLDNKGQFLYRVMGDKAAAKEWFDKAHEEKPGQIDSLWFLSRYDLDNGNPAAAIEKLETALEGRFSPLNFVDKATVEAEIKRLRG